MPRPMAGILAPVLRVKVRLEGQYGGSLWLFVGVELAYSVWLRVMMATLPTQILKAKRWKNNRREEKENKKSPPFSSYTLSIPRFVLL